MKAAKKVFSDFEQSLDAYLIRFDNGKCLFSVFDYKEDLDFDNILIGKKKKILYGDGKELYFLETWVELSNMAMIKISFIPEKINYECELEYYITYKELNDKGKMYYIEVIEKYLKDFLNVLYEL